jgi:acyl carrier protein
MSTDIFDRLKDFTIKQAGVTEEEVTEDASLENDLGVSGDDAVEFIVAFSKEFNVDVSKFMAAEYFSPEGDVILPTIIGLFTGKKKARQKDLTIKHLEKAVIAGRLDEEVINS